MRYLLLIFILSFLYAETNLSLYKDKKYLNSLLKKIELNSSKDEALLLEKTLILKLLQPPPKPDIPKIKTDIKTPQNILGSIHQSFDILEKLSALKAKKERLKNKIKTLQLQSPKDNTITALQLGFDEKKLQNIDQQIKIYQEALNKISAIIQKSFLNIDFDLKKIDLNIKNIKEKISYTKEKIDSLQLKIERYNLINDIKSVKYLQNILKNYQNKIKELKQELYAQKILKIFALLKDKNPKAIMLKNSLLKSMPNSYKEFYSNFLNNIVKSTLGTINTFKYSTYEEIKNEIHLIWKFLNRPLFTINEQKISILKLLLASILILIGFIIGSFYKLSIKKIDSKSISNSTKTLLANMGYYVILIIFFFISLNILHIDLSSIALVAGALSVGIGFGLQNIVSNFVSGIILMFERSIKIGDYIEIDNELKGHVTDIRMRSTTINTNDNIDIIVPNQKFIENSVINWTMNDKIRRFEIPFGVAYGTDVQKVIDVVIDAVKKAKFNNIYETQKRKTTVIMSDMGDSSINFKLFVWIKGDDIYCPQITRSKFLIIIYNALYKHNIEIPFPQRDLHLRSIDKEITLNIALKKDRR